MAHGWYDGARLMEHKVPLWAIVALLLWLLAGCDHQEARQQERSVSEQQEVQQGESSGSEMATKPTRDSNIPAIRARLSDNFKLNEDLQGKFAFGTGALDPAQSIYTLDANGSNITRLSYETADLIPEENSFAVGKDPTWSPNLKKLAFTRVS
jgi:hypothetical protein